ncbi:MAG: hypothetical protein A3B68_08400 [Candidatus Melainabacteria bacterium RIFCSPHIGHO2_02_FULL_34_12]|nr:MAG: hypothetical protein A3B68_08400 [Candidatus Melainabacteria bacterium RIFCSPHIGHO2_02_FULL_34_12]
MPPRTPRKPIARSKGYDPTVSIASASSAKMLNPPQESLQQLPQPQEVQKQEPQQKGNDDLKKLIETLKNKLGNNTGTAPTKQAPPTPKPKNTWNRSIGGKEKTWSAKPAYTILTRVSNHEKVPVSKKGTELTINSLPHAFLYKPGANGIKIDKLSIKSGKQIGIG